MSLRKPKKFSSAKEIFKSYFPKTTNETSDVVDERYKCTDYDFPKKLADNFRSSIKGKQGR